MTDRPIIFSEPMVKALMAGRKTQTRRIAKFIEPRGPQFYVRSKAGGWFGPEARVAEVAPEHARYAKGDRLYVRESYMPLPAPEAERPRRWGLAYAATGGVDHFADAPADFSPMLYNHERWTPSIHMPRWASRLTLIVEDVRVERLREISNGDAREEGVEKIDILSMHSAPWRDYTGRTAGAMSAKESFATLWQSLHDKPGQRWEDNPFVVALTFHLEKCNIDLLEQGGEQ